MHLNRYDYWVPIKQHHDDGYSKIIRLSVLGHFDLMRIRVSPHGCWALSLSVHKMLSPIKSVKFRQRLGIYVAASVGAVPA